MFEVDFHILNQKSTPAIYADDLANRPAFGFAGRIFINTVTPYGVYRDTGTSWVQIASNGGTGSTGVNGLNGTTNIGLGGTLTSNTLISGANSFNLNLQNLFVFQSNSKVLSFLNEDFSNNSSEISSGNGNFLQLRTSNNVSGGKSIIIIEPKKIKSTYQDINYGLNLDFNNQRFALGDYDILGGKKNSLQIDDNLSKIYLTTGRSSTNNVPDLFYAENTSSAVRVVKLGDFGNFNNKFSLQINDGGNILFTTTTIGNNGIYITNQSAILGAQTQNGYLFLNIDYTQNIISTFNTAGTDTGLKLNFNNKIYTFGGFNVGGNIIEIDDQANTIKFETSSLIFNGATLEDPTPGVVATKALLITLNGTQYKINLY